MKNNSIILVLLFIVGFSANAQTIQGTVKAGSIANSVIVAIRPSATITASKISTFYFSLAIPATVTPRPTAAILNNFNTAISYTLENVLQGTSTPLIENIGGTNYYVYNFLGDGAQTAGLERDITTSDNNMVEIFFNGGPAGTQEVRLVNIANGGQSSNSFFNIFDKGSDRTNQTSMFYGTSPVNNGGYDQTSYTGIGNISLPVKFLSFFALKNGNDAKLNWTVESDENNRHFEVERSVDGRVFKSFAKVDAKGNGKSVNTYELTDADISKLGVNLVYYRIKQTDKNGELTYSNVKNLNNVKKSTPVQLFPNPVKAITKVVVDVDAPGKGSIVIRDMAGKMVRQINTLFIKGINQQDLNVAELASGEYTIQVIGEGFSHQLKLTKVN
ncbi:T9SS type A sorting domain-containing protein [Phnomibacter sp. MR]|uniref:T9SS type A sorting domain-containing protein n=1 Tax=Phnomibacter sp. MR TaxID=3042318 RepID=UPI003A7FA146